MNQTTAEVPVKAAGIYCIACLENIDPRATICPYCSSPQKISVWVRAKIILQWLAGAFSVISLVLGVITLNHLFQDWDNKRMLVSDMVATAEKLRDTGLYPQAWKVYSSAFELIPSFESARKGQVDTAMVWLRHIRIKKGEKFTQIVDPIIPVLYRGLASAQGQRKSDLLAHIAWTYYLKDLDRKTLTPDDRTSDTIDNLFEQAVAIERNNIFARAMWAYWLIYKQPAFEVDLVPARIHFIKALEAASSGPGRPDETYHWIRKHQLRALENKKYSDDPDIKIEMLRVLNEMRMNGEPVPNEHTRHIMLQLYGRKSNARNVEQLIRSMSPRQHLETFSWLFKDLYPNEGINPIWYYQKEYVIARLNEVIGKTEIALIKYQELSATVREELGILVDNGIERITLRPTPRAIARRNRQYIDDPMTEGADPWLFHKDTMLNFNPAYLNSNTLQAYDYFENLSRDSSTIQKMSEVIAIFEKTRKRVIQWMEENKKYRTYETYKMDNAKENLITISIKIGVFALIQGKLNKSIAELEDLKKQKDSVLHVIYYTLAQAYSQRSQRYTKNEAHQKNFDIDNALKYLKLTINFDIKQGGALDWAYINNNPMLSPMRPNLKYKALMRGRS